MGIEIDILPVGGSRSGDAIVLRYGNLTGPRDQQRVVVIDGGYTADGQAILNHLDYIYKTNDIDLVINTHPDRDHINGLTTVIENTTVKCLLMHDPGGTEPLIWKGSALAAPMPYLAHLEKSLDQSRALLETARVNNVHVIPPFTDLRAGAIHICGPTEDYYSALLAAMTREPQAKTALAHGQTELLLKHSTAVGTATETLYEETLPESGTTSPSNNTSVITLLSYEGVRVLFTGDAGPPALLRATNELTRLGIAPGDLDAVQVPHHGSRYNVTPTRLTELLGPITSSQRGIAFVSVAEENPTLQFPARQTTNAFRRRGYPVLETAGRVVNLSYGDTPTRVRADLEPLPLYNRVETFGDD